MVYLGLKYHTTVQAFPQDLEHYYYCLFLRGTSELRLHCHFQECAQCDFQNASYLIRE